MAQYFFLILFCIALLITLITDYLYLLIHRGVTLFLIPIFLLGAYFCLTSVTLLESLAGVLVGYGFLWLFKTIYTAFRSIEGIGQGDLELLALIGSFLGPLGVFYTITLGSTLGTLVALVLIALKRADGQTALPFGSFLVIGCFMYLALMTAGHL